MTVTISGIVRDATATPVARTLRLLLSSDGSFVGETISNSGTGAYSFTGLDGGELYDAIMLDPNYNPGGAMIFTNIAPITSAGGGFIWDATDNDGMTLSDGDSSAVNAGSGSWALVRAVDDFTSGSGKKYWELESLAAAGVTAFTGLCSTTLVVPGSVFGNSTDFAFAWRAAGNNQSDGVNNAFGILPYGPGDTACIAMDFATGDYWLRVNGGAWHGGGDPETATTPTGNTIFAGVMKAFFLTDNQPEVNQMKLRGTISDINYTVPVGFTTPH